MQEARAVEIMRKFEEDKEDNMSTPSTKSKHQLAPVDDSGSNYKTGVRNGRFSETSTERQNNAAMKSRAELARLREFEDRERERKRADRAKKLKTDLEKIKEERK